MNRGVIAGDEMQSKSILIVEDDHNIRLMLRDTLEYEGYKVFTVPHGQEALDALKGMGQPGLILLDLNMPVMDGFQFLAAKAADPSIADIPVVVVSAEKDAASMVRERGQIQGVIAKPIEHEALLVLVRRYCGKSGA